MEQRLHLVFGGELVDPTKNVFKDVDNAHMRYYITHLNHLHDENAQVSSTEKLG